MSKLRLIPGIVLALLVCVLVISCNLYQPDLTRLTKDDSSPNKSEFVKALSEEELMQFKRKASMLVETITDRYIREGKLKVDKVVDTSPGPDGKTAKGYVGVEFASDAALNEYIAETRPVVERVLGAGIAGQLYAGATVSAKELPHDEWQQVDIRNPNTIIAGYVSVELMIMFKCALFWNWHNWIIRYADSDYTLKAAHAHFSLQAIKKGNGADYSLHSLDEVLEEADGSGVTTLQLDDPVLQNAIVYTEGIYDDYKTHTWWRDVARCKYMVTLYNSKIHSGSDGEEKLWYYREQGGAFVPVTN